VLNFCLTTSACCKRNEDTTEETFRMWSQWLKLRGAPLVVFNKYHIDAPLLCLLMAVLPNNSSLGYLFFTIISAWIKAEAKMSPYNWLRAVLLSKCPSPGSGGIAGSEKTSEETLTLHLTIIFNKTSHHIYGIGSSVQHLYGVKLPVNHL